MTRVGMHEAKTNLSKLVAQVEASQEEIVIERRGVPVARLVAIERDKPNLRSIRGSMKGEIVIGPDFNELPDDIAEAFGMK
jgi:prevent-host-death family protein